VYEQPANSREHFKYKFTLHSTPSVPWVSHYVGEYLNLVITSE